MAELLAVEPAAGLLPVAHGNWRLGPVDTGPLTWISPFRGKAAEVSARLLSEHGLGFPEPGRMTEAGAVRCAWFGREQALLMGGGPEGGLDAFAGVSEQSDAWVALCLSGEGGAEVLARLVPVDLRLRAFGPGEVCRTRCQHVNVLLARLSPDRILILGFRSMAKTLVHEIGEAMRMVAARAQDG